MPSRVESSRADQALKEAHDLYGKHLYDAAEKSCWLAIDLYEEAHATYVEPQLLLGEILYREGRKDEAYEQISNRWRPGRFPNQDLLMVIVGSQMHKGRSGELSFTAMDTYLRNNLSAISDRIHDVHFLPGYEKQGGNANTTLHQKYVASLLLFGADPQMDPKESLEWLADAEKAHPNLPLTAYLRGRALAKLGNIDSAKREFQFAIVNGIDGLKAIAGKALKSLPN